MVTALEERCGRYTHWNRPAGGFFLWLTLGEAVDPAALADAARQLGVSYVGGGAFFLDGGGQRNVRLAYSFVPEREIPEAIIRLGRALEQAARTAAR
jgi:DNA-binding transcriptional MocR family regulator